MLLEEAVSGDGRILCGTTHVKSLQYKNKFIL